MDPFAIVLEYMPLGTLYDFIYNPPPNRPTKMDANLAISLAMDVAAGMAFIHMHRLIHRFLFS